MRSLAVKRIILVTTAIAGVLALSGTALAVSAAVAIETFRFIPPAVTVNVGDSVTWTNRDAAQHTATAPGAFDTGPLSQGQSRAIVMGTAGTFAYRCSIHPTMTGTVQVVGPPPPTAAPTAAPTPVPTAAVTSAPIPQPTATAAPAPTIVPTPNPPPLTPVATAMTPAASPSPAPVAALVPQASPAADVPPEPAAAGSEGSVGLITGAGAAALAGAAAGLVLWRSRRRAA